MQIYCLLSSIQTGFFFQSLMDKWLFNNEAHMQFEVLILKEAAGPLSWSALSVDFSPFFSHVFVPPLYTLTACAVLTTDLDSLMYLFILLASVLCPGCTRVHLCTHSKSMQV